MLSILNLKSSVTHWVVFYATLIVPILCYSYLLGAGGVENGLSTLDSFS